jgi:hypothetical protein
LLGKFDLEPLLPPDRLERLLVDELLVRSLTFGVVGVSCAAPSDPLKSLNFLLKNDDLIRGTFGVTHSVVYVVWKNVSFVIVWQLLGLELILKHSNGGTQQRFHKVIIYLLDER